MPLFDELKRRNVFRVGIAYIITAWLIAQVSELAAQSFGAPSWVMKMIITMLLLGFPLALFFAWAYELTPEGLRRESDVLPGQSITDKTAGRLNRAIIFALILALAWMSWDKFLAEPRRDGADLESALRDAAQVQIDEAANADAAPGPERSIAVLPFVNMSEEAGNEYFADGLSEELLNMLVKNGELRVAARTSSFSFKGKDVKISDIARELNVSHILEGSVRKSGDTVRITVQLIKADDGFHLWSKNFDRTLNDIFAVQDEIAAEVTRALEVSLLGASQADRAINPETYALGLKGLYFLQQRGRENLEKSRRALEEALELDPGYAPAWQLLAMNYYLKVSQNYTPREEGYAAIWDAVGRAIDLDPDDGTTWAAYGFLKKNLDWDWDSAQAALTRAHELDPNVVQIGIWRASLAQTLGRLDEATEIYHQVLASDPLNISAHSSLGIMFTKTRRFDEAVAIFKRQIELRPHYHWAHFNLGKVYLFQGDAEKALAEIEKNPPNEFRDVGLVLAYSTLGREEEAQAVLQGLVAREHGKNPTWIAQAYAWRGENDQAFQWLEEALVQRDVGLAYLLNSTVFERLTGDPRWLDVLQSLDLLKHWQAMPPEYGGPTRD